MSFVEQEVEEFEEIYQQDIGQMMAEKKSYPVEGKADAEKRMRFLKYFKREMEERKVHVAEQKLLLDRYTYEIQRKIDYHRQALEEYLLASGKRKEKFVQGSINLSKGKEKVVVNSVSELEKWDQSEKVGSLEYHPDVKAIQEYIETNEGEIPDGCDLVTGKDVFNVRLT